MGDKKIALVTGASSGLGREFCRQLALRCDVIIAVARRGERLLELQEELLGVAEVHPLAADLATVEGVARTIETLRQKGPVDYLINNAGMSTYGQFSEQAIDSQQQMVALQINAVMALCRAAIPFMKQRGGGAIINVSSVSSFVPYPTMTVYGGCKAFLTSFSEALDMELAEYGIDVQCLCPGLVRTEFHSTQSMADFQLSAVPDNHWGEVSNIVSASLSALGADNVIFAPGEENLRACREGVNRVLQQLN